MAVTLVLHGHFKGRDVVLNSIPFKKGVAKLPGTFAQNEGVISLMGRSYQAYPEGMSPEEGAANAEQTPASVIGDAARDIAPAPVLSRFAPKGSPEYIEKKEQPAVEGESPKLVDVLNTLDPENDEHWTQNGLASLDVVSEAVGEHVSRKDIEDAAPDFNRDVAREKKGK
jgi:hypothetical protein